MKRPDTSRLAAFVHHAGLSDLMFCEFTEKKRGELCIQTPTNKVAEKLWLNHTLIAHSASLYLPEYSIVNINGTSVKYPVYIQETMTAENLSFEILTNSDLPLREKDIILTVMASNQSFAIVRDEDNRVICAGQNIVRFCTAPAGRWSNYDITELWRQDNEPEGVRPKELERMYSYRDRGEMYIPEFEYVAYRGGFDPQTKSIVRGNKAKFVSNVWFLSGHYFGEPCRLVMATHAEDL